MADASWDDVRFLASDVARGHGHGGVAARRGAARFIGGAGGVMETRGVGGGREKEGGM